MKRKDKHHKDCNICKDVSFTLLEIKQSEYRLRRNGNHIHRHILAIARMRITDGSRENTLGKKVITINKADDLFKFFNQRTPQMLSIDNCEHCFNEAELQWHIGFWSGFLTDEGLRHYNNHKEYDEVLGEYDK